MSSCWSYNFAVYGDPEKLRGLENALPNLTYETELGEQVRVFHVVRDIECHYGFLAVHADRNYGGVAPLSRLCEISPQLTFGGMFHNEMCPDRHWSWEIRNGLLTVEEHVDDDLDWEGREITPDEIKGEIKKLTAKIETLTREWRLLGGTMSDRVMNVGFSPAGVRSIRSFPKLWAS
jgi:hypothetical protein